MHDNETRVCVIDDNEDAVEALVDLLRAYGYSVESATDGIAGLALIERFKPHCVLLDVRMPRLNGHELTKRLRSAHGSDIVLIAISGGDPSDAEVAGTFNLVDYYMTKPIDMDRLGTILPPNHE
jgi:DNA-binding response OmpR family regulator